ASPPAIGAADRSATGDKMALRSEIITSDASTGEAKVRILVPNVPPLGYKLIELHASKPGLVLGDIQTESKTVHIGRGPLQGTATSLENEFLRVTVDPKTGCMTSLFDKRNNT